MDGRPSRLSLSKRKRRARKEERQNELEKKLKNDDGQSSAAEEVLDYDSKLCSGMNEDISVIEILSSDDEGIGEGTGSPEVSSCKEPEKDQHKNDMPPIAMSTSPEDAKEPKEGPRHSSKSPASSTINSEEEPFHNDPGACRDGINTITQSSPSIKDGPPNSQLSYKSSAYTQNLAEIAFDILNDARWRSSNKRLFQWEYGDDLSVLHSFGRLFILPSVETEEGNSRDGTAADGDESDSESDDEELHARCMHLYARLFHRKGPWFQITDIFVRYYHRDYIRRKRYEKNDDENEAEAAGGVNDVSWDSLETSLNDCMLDLCRLLQMGVIRSFSSEGECGDIVGRSDSKLLTEKDKMKVLHKLGGKSLKNGSNAIGVKNEILKQMKSQKTMLFHKKGSTCMLPVRNHVNDTILNAFATKLNGLITVKRNRTSSTQDIKYLLKRMWNSVSAAVGIEMPFLTTFRLREQPLLTLRRACRLYLLAGDGPGSMKWSGSNAWISVIETGENFTAQRNEEKVLLKGICTMPDPPSATLWHQVAFHGLNYRMGLKFFPFADNYVRIPARAATHDDGKCNSKDPCVEIFCDPAIFKTWELCAELRCITDYVVEWNRLILYADRKLHKTNNNSPQDIKDRLEPCTCETFDALSVHGRSKLCHQLTRFCAIENLANVIHERVERIICSLHPTATGCNDESEGGDSFLTDAERMICSIGIICSQVMLFFFENLSDARVSHILNKPWLRHLQPESVLAYIVWATIETVEKRGYHEIACQMLEAIIFGFVIEDSGWKYDYYLKRIEEKIATSHVSQVLLSRRVRGKALERLFIDKKHAARRANPKKNTRKGSTPCHVDTFTAHLIPTIASTALVPFSFIRKFARRTKQPLMTLLDNAWSAEMFELGIRLVDNANTSIVPGMKSSIREKQWSPTVDVSVANAIRHDSDSGVGRRCAFIGDEELNGLEHTRSLNVEELAIELYAAGKLPVDETNDIHKVLKGEWKGWHCEGVHVRILFRILCASLLHETESHIDNEQYTIFLQSYQAAPLDLHVAYGIFHDESDSKTSARVIRSFYQRRRKVIEEYFKKLEGMSPQELGDLVFESVTAKIDEVKRLGKRFANDQTLFKDIQQVRTLSMLAAGFGGQQLASMFRLLCFDYRHYGAGLPDLLLVRAFVHESTDAGDVCQSLDLHQWIGEVFQHSPTCTSAILEDRDEEFIGGSLNERQALSSSNQRRSNKQEGWTFDECDPERLLLSQDGSPITVDCMFVEVKSHNDRLDDRQEDWLNILDRFGNARLCKFKSSAKDNTT